MSMVLTLTTACDRTLDAIIATPPLVLKLLDPAADPAAFAPPPPPRPGFLARLFGTKPVPAAPPTAPHNLELGPNDSIATDLDKAWHGIHFLLTGTDWEGDMPQAFLLRGGMELKGIDIGYGPPRLLKSHEVAQVADYLSTISRDDLAARFDPRKMEQLDIYPSIWHRDDPGNLDYLLEHYDQLQSFLTMARDKQLGLVLAMS